jgi:hypothetical protein
MNDALTQLGLAYKYKADRISQETLPDPLKGDSFRNRVGKEELRKTVDAIEE